MVQFWGHSRRPGLRLGSFEFSPPRSTHLHEREHDKNAKHFGLTQEAEPDYSDYEEPDGNGLHGCHSHLQLIDPETLAADIAVYYGMVSFVDHCVGRILDRLEALGLADDTLVVFTSDHGHFFGQHGLGAKGPFMYEDLVRVPLIASMPSAIPAGQKSSALHSLVDLAPTFLSACGLPVPRSMTGSNQWPAWTSSSPDIRDHVIVENRLNPYRLNQRTYIDKRYKLTVYCEQDEGEMFDLEKDPGERDNLWNQPAYESLKCRLLQKYCQAELRKEPVLMPRVSSA